MPPRPKDHKFIDADEPIDPKSRIAVHSFDDLIKIDLKDVEIIAPKSAASFYCQYINLEDSEATLSQIEKCLKIIRNKRNHEEYEDVIEYLYNMIIKIYSRGREFALLCRTNKIQLHLDFSIAELTQKSLTIAMYSAILNPDLFIKNPRQVMELDNAIKNFPEYVLSIYSYLIESIFKGEEVDSRIGFEVGYFLKSLCMFGFEYADAFFRIASYCLDNILTSDKVTEDFKEECFESLDESAEYIFGEFGSSRDFSAIESAYKSAYNFYSIYAKESKINIPIAAVNRDLFNDNLKQYVINYILMKENYSEFDIDEMIDAAKSSSKSGLLLLLKIFDEKNAQKILDHKVFTFLAEQKDLPVRESIKLFFLMSRVSKAFINVFYEPGVSKILTTFLEEASRDPSLEKAAGQLVKKIKPAKWTDEMFADFESAGFFGALSIFISKHESVVLINNALLIVWKTLQAGHVSNELVSYLQFVEKMIGNPSKQGIALSVLESMISDDSMHENPIAVKAVINQTQNGTLAQKIRKIDTNDDTKEMIDNILVVINRTK